MAYKGRFKMKNPSKYKGDPSKVIYRSLWELKFFRYVDQHPDIIWWASEEYVVPYMSPVDGKMHRYYPDVVVHKKTPAGTLETVMIEIKPAAQTKAPDISKKNKTPTGRISRRYLNEVKTFGINEAKWNAAEKFCADRGWSFIKMTEKHLGIKY